MKGGVYNSTVEANTGAPDITSGRRTWFWSEFWPVCAHKRRKTLSPALSLGVIFSQEDPKTISSASLNCFASWKLGQQPCYSICPSWVPTFFPNPYRLRSIWVPQLICCRSLQPAQWLELVPETGACNITRPAKQLMCGNPLNDIAQAPPITSDDYRDICVTA